MDLPEPQEYLLNLPTDPFSISDPIMDFPDEFLMNLPELGDISAELPS
jgi:hypothetical protein